MKVLGMGIISARGAGVEAFRNALTEGWEKPSEIDAPFVEDERGLAYTVDLSRITDRTLFGKMRRADRLSRMAVYAAAEALKNSGLDNIERQKIGIITATAFGPHVTTFGFLDDIIRFGEAGASPTLFSNSVHNASTSYISSALGIEGPTLTVTEFFFSFQSALQLANAWLDEGRCDYVLLGTAEQYGDVLGYIYKSKLISAPDGIIRPFGFERTCQVPGEGSAFFMLGNNETDHYLCAVDEVEAGSSIEYTGKPDLLIIDTDGLLDDESAYRQDISDDIHVAAYSPLFGSMMTGSAFNFAAATLMLKEQVYYASPVTDNLTGVNILAETMPANIELIKCVRYNCYGKRASIYLKRK